ncbi:MAG: hypothetical protein K2L19_05835 [Eubacterium sp.]|nr:hypothetical protein [Eubacterium sp.]
MKIKDVLMLIILLLSAGILIIFSADAKIGASQGFALAQNTIIPSLIPLLIIFFIIMKTGAKDVLAKAFGFISIYIFNLPQVTLPAIFFGLTGGYPTGALLTNELYIKGEIDEKQAQRLMRFNFCGGCGFIITALGTATLNNTKAGAILFLSNLISAIIIGFLLSFTDKRINKEYYSYTDSASFGDALINSTQNAVNAVLNMTAYIILFSAVCNIFTIPQVISPFIEITNGLCSGSKYPLTQLGAYLSFGGLCIHCQLLPIISNIKMKYYDFLFFRIFAGLLSYCTTKLLLIVIPIEISVFSNASISTIPQISSVNMALSILMIIGCFVIIADISSKKKLI